MRATAACSFSSTPRSARTRATSSSRRRWRRPTPSTSWPSTAAGLICLALTPERAKQLHLELMSRSNRSRHSHRLHGVDRGARRGLDRHLGARPRAHHRRRHRPDQGLSRHRHAGPRLPAGRPGRRRAGPRRPYRGCRRSRAPRRALSGRRHLRDHERRRHHGAAARPGRLCAASRAEDRRPSPI